jgi:hypothetical protein
MSREDHDDRQNSREDLEAWRSAALLRDEPDPGRIIDCPTCGGALFARDDECLAGAVERIAASAAAVARVQAWIDANALAGEYDYSPGYQTVSVVTPGAVTRRRCADEVRAALAGKDSP